MAAELVQPGDVVWDIGANLGLFAFAAAARAGSQGRVFAAEPDTWLVSLLHRSAREPSRAAAPVEILPLALSDSIGLARFHIATRARAASFLDGAGTDAAGGVRETQTVMSTTLDWLCQHIPAPNVLKIDVEGAELQVLRGAEKLLTTARPKLLCEVSRNAEQVSALLRRLGYELYDATTEFPGRQPTPVATWDTLALPSHVGTPSII
jgi:FkbM family methyltransferase